MKKGLQHRSASPAPLAPASAGASSPNFRFYDELAQNDPAAFVKAVKDFRQSRTLEHPLERTLQLKREAVDEQTRTVTLSVSSEAPVERWFGVEVLGHSAGEVDTSRLDAAAPMLWMHDWMDQRGVVEGYELKDSKLYTTLRFSENPKAEELWKDVKAGIIQNVSIGYRVLEFDEGHPSDPMDKESPWVFRATKWAMLEVSFVSVPADCSVGMGRVAQVSTPTPPKQEKTMTRMQELSQKVQDGTASEAEKAELHRLLTPPPAAEPKGPSAEEVRKAEQIRALGISELADKFPSPNVRTLAKKAIESGQSVAEFGMQVLEDRGQAKPIDATKPQNAQGHIEMDGADRKAYNIGNALRIHLGMAKEDGVEWEAHKELVKRGLETKENGILIPLTALRFGTQGEGAMRQALQAMGRVQEATTPSKGGVLVQQVNMGYDDLLRNRMMTMAMGVRNMPGLRDNVAIPRLSSGATAYWLAPEGQDITESEAAFGQVTMSPKTVGALVAWTRQLAQQANPAIDAIMADDLNKALALAIDKAILHGTGAAGQPLGIANTSGVSAPDLSTATWAKIVAMETLVAMANADVATMGMLTTPQFRGILKTREKATNTAQFIWAGGEVNGYRADVTNQVSSSFAFLADWAQAVLGGWGALELAVSEHTKFASGGIALRGLQTVDVAVRQPGAFAVSSNAS